MIYYDTDSDCVITREGLLAVVLLIIVTLSYVDVTSGCFSVLFDTLLFHYEHALWVVTQVIGRKRSNCKREAVMQETSLTFLWRKPIQVFPIDTDITQPTFFDSRM